MAVVEIVFSIAIVGAAGRTALESRHFGHLLLVALLLYCAVFALIMFLAKTAPDLTSLYTTVGLAVLVSIEEGARLFAFHWLARSPLTSPRANPFFIRAGYGAAYGVIEFVSKWGMIWIGWIRPGGVCPGIQDACDSLITTNAIFLFPILLHITVSSACYMFGISGWKGLVSFASAVFVHWQYNDLVLHLDSPHSGTVVVIVLGLAVIYASARLLRQRDPWGHTTAAGKIARDER